MLMMVSPHCRHSHWSGIWGGQSSQPVGCYAHVFVLSGGGRQPYKLLSPSRTCVLKMGRRQAPPLSLPCRDLHTEPQYLVDHSSDTAVGVDILHLPSHPGPGLTLFTFRQTSRSWPLTLNPDIVFVPIFLAITLLQKPESLPGCAPRP